MRGGGAPYHDPNARGVFVGLNLAQKRENIVRAVLEGVAFNLRIFLENIIAKGVEVEEIRFIGGGAKGHLWRQIIADINGKEVMATNLSQEANSLGAAMVGAVGVGMFDSFEEMKEVVKIKGSSIPDLKAHETYNQIYPLFKETYHKLKDIFSGLSVFQG